MIAALTLPKSKATKVAEQLVDLGIKALWNFAPVDLHFPEELLVENVHPVSYPHLYEAGRKVPPSNHLFCRYTGSFLWNGSRGTRPG